jgi:hypothetical protein
MQAAYAVKLRNHNGFDRLLHGRKPTCAIQAQNKNAARFRAAFLAADKVRF